MNNNHDIKLKKYKVSILKENYFLVSDENEEHIIKSIELLNNCLKNIIVQIPAIELRKASVLAALQLASRLLKSLQEIEHFRNYSDQLTNFIDVNTAQLEKTEKV